MNRRTYWHLEGQARKPTEYDIASSRLLAYPALGFEVKTPGAAWFARHQLTGATDWERFRDPRETTYARYVERQQAREIFVDGLLALPVDEARLSPAWRATLEDFLCPLRYPLHGLQLVTAYVGQLGPSGKIVIACAFQGADEIRRIQRIAYRMRQLQETYPGFGEGARARWQADPRWQPVRRLVEELLVAYDWGEAFTALCLVVKPLLDGVATTALGRAAERAGDDVLARVLGSLDEDCLWHREWSDALARLALEAHGAAMRGWVRAWRPRALAAIEALDAFVPGASRDVIRAHADRLHALGLEA